MRILIEEHQYRAEVVKDVLDGIILVSAHANPPLS